MARPLVFDASIFIQAARGRIPLERIVDPLASGQAFMSSVVAHELWAGTRNREDAEALSMVLRGFERLGHVLTPSHEDWILAGRLVNRYRRLYGALNPRDHSHDILIVLSASQVDAVVITTNLRHMDRWAELARRAGRSVRVRSEA